MSAAVLVLGWNLIVLTLFVASGDQFIREFDQWLRMNCILPLALLAGQAPIWLGRIILGWRIRRPGGASAEKERRFGILEIMMAMTYFGGAIALTRFAFNEDDPI